MEAETIYERTYEPFKLELIAAAKDLGEQRKTILIKKNHTVADIQKYLRKEFKLQEDATINIYIGEAFIPSPQESLYDIKEKFGTSDNTLIMRFSTLNIYG